MSVGLCFDYGNFNKELEYIIQPGEKTAVEPKPGRGFAIGVIHKQVYIFFYGKIIFSRFYISFIFEKKHTNP